MFIEAKDDGGGGDNWTTGAISRAKLQSNPHHQQTNIQFFTGRMPFLSPNQQCQSTEGKYTLYFYGTIYCLEVCLLFFLWLYILASDLNFDNRLERVYPRAPTVTPLKWNLALFWVLRLNRTTRRLIGISELLSKENRYSFNYVFLQELHNWLLIWMVTLSLTTLSFVAQNIVYFICS